MRLVTPDLKEDFAASHRHIFRQTLWPHQFEVATDAAFITTVAAARRTGKTTIAESLAIHTSLVNRRCKVLIISSTQDAARRLTEDINSILGMRRLFRESVDEGWSTRIKLTNGSEIISLPPSPRQIRGYGKGVKLVIVDEAGFVSNECWSAAHYTALDERANGSRILLIGTPWGNREAFFRLSFERGYDGDPDYSSYQWTHEVNPRLDHIYLERQRDRVSPVEYAAEILGEWSDAGGSFFRRDLLDAATAPVIIPEFKNLSPPARGIAGIDYGVSFDLSAIVVVYRLPINVLNSDSEPKPRFIALPYTYKASALLSDVVDDVFAQREAFSYVSTETTGVGAGPSQDLRGRLLRGEVSVKVNPVATTAMKKTAAYSCILRLLERRQLILPRDPMLLRQLSGLRFEQGARSFKFEPDNPSTHDDVADALALATLPYNRRSGELACKLGSLSSPRAVDDSVVTFVGPTVETGGGMKVWEQPPLQSVEGQGISYTGNVKQKTEDLSFSKSLRLRRLTSADA
jgi:hypothetical protein